MSVPFLIRIKRFFGIGCSSRITVRFWSGSCGGDGVVSVQITGPALVDIITVLVIAMRENEQLAMAVMVAATTWDGAEVKTLLQESDG